LLAFNFLLVSFDVFQGLFESFRPAVPAYFLDLPLGREQEISRGITTVLATGDDLEQFTPIYFIAVNNIRLFILRVEFNRDEVFPDHINYIRIGIGGLIHFFTPATPVGINIHQNDLFFFNPFLIAFIPAVPVDLLFIPAEAH